LEGSPLSLGKGAESLVEEGQQFGGPKAVGELKLGEGGSGRLLKLSKFGGPMLFRLRCQLLIGHGGCLAVHFELGELASDLEQL
jgi:hypothetical protein